MSPNPRKTLEAALDQVGRGDATPVEANVAIRDALTFEPPLIERVYDALRDVAWRTLTSRSFGADLQQWFEVFRHASSLAGKNSGGIADKIRAHADLISQSVRFAELQPLEEVLGRKHSQAVLGAIATAGQAVRNSTLKSILGLADSNLSRVTGALQGIGLIDRSAAGKEASFALTEFGRKIAKQLDLVVNDNAAADREWWQSAPYGVAVWDRTGAPIGGNSAFHSIAVPHKPQELPTLNDWKLQMSTTARAERMLSKDTVHLKTSDKQWLQFVERTTLDGRSCVLVLDASAPMAAMTAIEQELAAANSSMATLRRELAEAQELLAAYRTAHTLIRDEMVTVAARSNEQVGRSIDNWAHMRGGKPPSELYQVRESLGAIQVAMRDFMEPISIIDGAHAKIDWLDPAQLMSEAFHAAQTLDPSISATYRFGRSTKVRGALIPLRMAVGHMLLLGMKRGAHSVHGEVKGSNLVATLRTETRVPYAYTDAFDDLTMNALRYCKAVVKTYGGAFEVEEANSDTLITMIFPITTGGHGTEFGPPLAKGGRSRKLTARSED